MELSEISDDISERWCLKQLYNSLERTEENHGSPQRVQSVFWPRLEPVIFWIQIYEGNVQPSNR